MANALPDHLIPRCHPDRTGTVKLWLIGGPHCGGYVPCSQEDLRPGQYEAFPGHSPDEAIPPTYAPCAFYVVEERNGQHVGVYAPNFNPYAEEVENARSCSS